MSMKRYSGTALYGAIVGTLALIMSALALLVAVMKHF